MTKTVVGLVLILMGVLSIAETAAAQPGRWSLRGRMVAPGHMRIDLDNPEPPVTSWMVTYPGRVVFKDAQALVVGVEVKSIAPVGK
jgi:hypothetical protein